MNQPPAQHPAGPSRRTVAKGAAWSAPVISFAAPAPAVAASGACSSFYPTFTTGWAYQDPASGSLVSPGSNKVYPGTDGVNYYAAVTTATSQQPATVKATETLAVQSATGSGSGLRVGCSYTVSHGLTAVPNQQGTVGHQVLSVQMLSPSGAVVSGSQASYVPSATKSGYLTVPYTTANNIHKTLTSPTFSFTAVAGTYSFVATFTSPTNYNASNIYADGLGFSAPSFVVAA